jgi:hypothetical protein
MIRREIAVADGSHVPGKVQEMARRRTERA